MDAPDVERLTRELGLRKRVAEALLVFSRATAARQQLEPALESLAADVASLFGTRRAAIWLHDREAAVLTLVASSDPRDGMTRPTQRSDEDSAIARALRADAPELSGTGEGACLTIPMRGWRRALGAVELEGEPSLPPGEYVEIAGDFARQLATLVENLLVVDEAIRRYGDAEQMRAELAQMRKLASLGEFAASLAHEINNPLQGVLGHLELLMGSLPGDDPHRATLQRIYGDAERAARIASHLLAFAGVRRAPKERVDVARLLADTLRIHEASVHRAPVCVAPASAGVLPDVLGDATLLQQAILNLLLNAEQAIAAAGRSGSVFVSTAAVDGRVKIVIEDTGPGIPPGDAARIFDPFFTTKEPGKGTGLGLAIATGIVEEHGGTITAGTSPRGGALFAIHLPAASDKVEASGSTR